MFNQQRFDNAEYDDDPIVKESIIWNQHIDKHRPNWMSTYFSVNEVSDSIDRLGFTGYKETRSFFNFDLKGLDLSYQDDFNANYKIAGFSVFRNLQKTNYSRSSYNLLGLIGEWGGFFEGGLVILGIIISPFSKFKAAVFFMQEAFYTTSE
jgi:hypothetical protein